MGQSQRRREVDIFPAPGRLGSGTHAGALRWMGGGTAPSSRRGQSQEAARPESGNGELRLGRHIRELFITGVASVAANEVTLRELVESVEARSLSLSHGHLALGRGQEWMSCQEGGSQGDRRAESALSGRRDVNGRAGKGTSPCRGNRGSEGAYTKAQKL